MYDLKLKDGDIEVLSGHIQQISGNSKLEQQLGKIILTKINFYLHPNYGSTIMELLGQGIYTTLEATVQATIRQAIDYFIQLQARGILFDTYDPEEILYKVVYIHTQQLENEPRGASVSIRCMDGTMKDVSIVQYF